MEAIEFINELIYQKSPGSVTIYMPTHRKGEEVQQDAIRLKNLVRKAQKSLIDKGLKEEDITLMLEDVRSLIKNTSFWQHQDYGLAIFLSADFFKYERLSIRFEEQLFVGDHFIITPLLPLMIQMGRFYVLALSQKDIRLYRASFENIEPVTLDKMPNNIKEFLKYDDMERQLQLRSSGGDAVVFHGHGGGIEDTKKNVERFVNEVENNITAYLNNEQSPLILAGVESITSMYRLRNKYKYLLGDSVKGNTDIMSDTKLHQKSRLIAEKYFMREIYVDLDKFDQLWGTDKCSTNINEIVKASKYGKIDTLLLASNSEEWGYFDEEKHEVHISKKRANGLYDLVNYSAVQTLINGGKTYAIKAEEMPQCAMLAAIYRY